MLEEMMQQPLAIIQNGVQKGAPKHKNNFQHLSRNLIRKKLCRGRGVQRTPTNQQDSLLVPYINTKIEGKNIMQG